MRFAQDDPVCRTLSFFPAPPPDLSLKLTLYLPLPRTPSRPKCGFIDDAAIKADGEDGDIPFTATIPTPPSSSYPDLLPLLGPNFLSCTVPDSLSVYISDLFQLSLAPLQSDLPRHQSSFLSLQANSLAISVFSDFSVLNNLYSTVLVRSAAEKPKDGPPSLPVFAINDYFKPAMILKTKSAPDTSNKSIVYLIFLSWTLFYSTSLFS